MDLSKVYGMLGLAARAGKVASGEFSTDKMVKIGKAWLVIVADDASENTKKMFRNMCDFYEVPFYVCSDKSTLGHTIGREQRASLAITDEGFAKAIERQLKREMDDGGIKHGE